MKNTFRRLFIVFAAMAFGSVSAPALALQDNAEAQIESFRKLLVEERYKEAVQVIRRMAEDSPRTLNVIPLDWVNGLIRTLEDAGSGRDHGRLLEVLSSDGYAPVENLGWNDDYRLEYAKYLFGNGNAEQAATLAASLKDPRLLARASLDHRFRAAIASDTNFRAIGEARLARNKELIARLPNMLRPTVYAANDLIQLGRPREAIEVLKAVESRLDTPGAFIDSDQMRNWWWDELARAHAELGQYEAAINSLWKGVAVNERSVDNVSQLLNLAYLQVRFGDGRGALATLANFGGRRASAYGMTVLTHTRGCAFALTGRMDAAARDLAYMREHEKDSPGNLRQLLLCMGDLDGAASVFIRHLENIEYRADVLMLLSDFEESPVANPKDPRSSHVAALKARPDIQAAIAQAGGIRRFNIQRRR